MFSKKGILKLFLSLIVIGFLLLIFISAYFLIQRNKTVVLPKPTGSFIVERVGYDWIDHTRNENYSLSKGSKRKLPISIWYPSDSNQHAKRTKYFPDNWEKAQEKDDGAPYLKQNFKTVQTNAYNGISLSTVQATYPLIILNLEWVTLYLIIKH